MLSRFKSSQKLQMIWLKTCKNGTSPSMKTSSQFLMYAFCLANENNNNTSKQRTKTTTFVSIWFAINSHLYVCLRSDHIHNTGIPLLLLYIILYYFSFSVGTKEIIDSELYREREKCVVSCSCVWLSWVVRCNKHTNVSISRRKCVLLVGVLKRTV